MNINYFIVYDVETEIAYLATLSEKTAHEWKTLANEGGCRGLAWPKSHYEVQSKARQIKDNSNTWEF